MVNKHFKKFYILPIIALIVLLATLWSWKKVNNKLSYSPNVTSEKWQTYSDQELGFSIKYPSNWSSPETFSYSTTKEVKFDNLSITVGVFYDQDIQKELSYIEAAERRANGKKLTHFSVDGFPAVRVNIKEDDLLRPKPNPYNVVVIQKGRTIYQVYSSFPNEYEFPEEYQSEQETFEQILNSFRFID